MLETEGNRPPASTHIGDRNPCRGTLAVKLNVFFAKEDENIAKKLRRESNGSVASIRMRN